MFISTGNNSTIRRDDPPADTYYKRWLPMSIRNHPAPGAKIPKGGTDFAENKVYCDKCRYPATRVWEGSDSYLYLCEDCHDKLGEWIS